MGKTTIEWATDVWNFIRGCTPVSDGCRECYAKKIAARFCGPGLAYEGLAEMTPRGARWTGKIRVVRHKLEEPLHWRKPRRVFVDSMSDLFHEAVPFSLIRDAFGVMAMAQRHIFMILTKRALDMERWFGSTEGAAAREYARSLGVPWPLPNVWIGVSVENKKAADERLPALSNVPAAKTFISAEPLLERIDISAALKEGVAWVIVGCETGPRTRVRPTDIDWVRDLRDQCRVNETAFFFKQIKDENGKTVSRPFLDVRQHLEWPR